MSSEHKSIYLPAYCQESIRKQKVQHVLTAVEIILFLVVPLKLFPHTNQPNSFSTTIRFPASLTFSYDGKQLEMYVIHLRIVLQRNAKNVSLYN